MTRRAALTIAAVSVMSAGCAGPGPQRIGFTQADILGATKKQVIDHMVSAKLAKNMRIRDVNDYGFTATKPIEGSFAASLLFGSRYDSTPEARIIYNVVDIPGGVRVHVRAAVVTNPGSAFERTTDVTNATSADIQRELEELQARFSQAVTKP